MENNTSNPSLFKNVIALYVRMIFSVCVNLYISRVVLDVLGVEDFGIYNIVGAIVVMLGFINSSMSGSTSRFLSIAIGENKDDLLSQTYNTAKHLHCLIAIVIFLLCEVFGVWIINSYLNIPPGRMLVANVLFQFSLLTTIASIIQVPYSALIIAKERLDVYAKIEIVQILLKLAVVLILPFISYDRLLVYGVLLFVVSIITFFIYRAYCNKTYNHLKFSLTLHPNIIKSMLNFSGWDLLGWGGVSLCTQGRQIFINKFFSVALNAASGVAATASAALSTFTNNVIMAFRPRIIKYYASNDFEQMNKLLRESLLCSLLLMNVLVVPMFFGMNFLLDLWLVEVPDFTLVFCKLLLINEFICVINSIIKIGIHASGNMPRFALTGFAFSVLNIVLTYILYTLGYPVYSTFIILVLLNVLNVVANFRILKINVPSTDIKELTKYLLKGVFICLIGFAGGGWIARGMDMNSFISVIFLGLVNFLIIFIFSFLFFGEDFKRIIKKISFFKK